jgi:hypothetical protein
MKLLEHWALNIQHLTRVTLTTLLHTVLNQSVSRVAITKTVSFTVLSTMFGKQIEKCLAFHTEKCLAFHIDLVSEWEVTLSSKTYSTTRFRRNLHSHIEKQRFKQHRESKQTINAL